MHIAIILVEIQMGENIGACARCMKNFGLSDLRLVKPRDGWPNVRAQNMSVGAIDIIKKAQIFDSIEEAINDLEYVYAATATPRGINKEYILSRDLPKEIDLKNKIGIMFGRESSGLNNEEISYANKILTIDTEINFSSLNIAHSVAVIAYEIFQEQNQKRDDLKVEEELADNISKQYFYDHLFDELDKKNFFKTNDKKILMSQKIRNIFNRIDNLSKSEMQILRGVITTLTKDKSSDEKYGK